MTAETQNNQTQENKPNDKEFNFRAIEAKLQQERAARIEAEKKAAEFERIAQEATTNKNSIAEEDDEPKDEPYVDHRRLSRQLASFEKKMEAKIDQKAEEKAKWLLEEEKKNSWIKNNPDFYEVLNQAEKFAMDDPELAESILEMPQGFARQKLVYKNIKKYLNNSDQKKSSVQDKIEANKRSPYYQPSNVGTAPYASAGDFSQAGQKNAYDKMQQLKKQLRI